MTKIGRIEEATEKKGGREDEIEVSVPSSILHTLFPGIGKSEALCSLFTRNMYVFQIIYPLVNDSYLFHNINGDGAMIFDAN